MNEKDFREHLTVVKDIVTSKSMGSGCYDGPTQLTDFLYIGNSQDAKSPTLLKCYGITHVLNCAALANFERDYIKKLPYPNDSGIKYEEFEAKDNDGYPILVHFPQAKRFIDDAKERNGKVLVHCEMGINRSAAICIAYMMVDEGLTLIQALKRVKRERKTVLINEGFQKHLIWFADERNLLHKV